MSPTFHLSFPVSDLAAAEAFYVGLLGAEVGRRREGWMDIWLFGAQITLHLAPDATLPVDGQGHRHFGAVMRAEAWQRYLDRVSRAGAHFVREPRVENAGLASEQSKFMIADPSGNHIEFKTYPNEAAALERPRAESAS